MLAQRQGGRGREPKLTPAQQHQVRTEVATGRFRTAAEVGGWKGTTFGGGVQPGGVASLLVRRQAAPTVPRPRHTKADGAGQEAWKQGGSPRR